MTTLKPKISIKTAILLVFIFNIIDYLFTIHVLKLGFIETNALMNYFVGTIYFPLIKLGLAVSFLLVTWKFHQNIQDNRIIKVIFFTCFSTYSLLMVYFLSLYMLGHV